MLEQASKTVSKLEYLNFGKQIKGRNSNLYYKYALNSCQTQQMLEQAS